MHMIKMIFKKKKKTSELIDFKFIYFYRYNEILNIKRVISIPRFRSQNNIYDSCSFTMSGKLI